MSEVKVRMEGPGIPGATYFAGIGAQGVITIESEEQLRAWVDQVVAEGGWPVNWTMTIEECNPDDCVLLHALGVQ